MEPSPTFIHYSTTIPYFLHQHRATAQQTNPSPVLSTSNSTVSIPIADNLPPQPDLEAAAAAKIQSAYRTHVVRTHFKEISSVHTEADLLQRQIQCQETVDALRRSEKEKLRMSEALMGLLFRLDSVPGVNQVVREARRKVSRKIVGLQEILDAICESKLDEVGGGGDGGGFLIDWDEVVSEMEEEVCRARGGDDMERFCAEYLGFRCLQRFLREP